MRWQQLYWVMYHLHLTTMYVLGTQCCLWLYGQFSVSYILHVSGASLTPTERCMRMMNSHAVLLNSVFWSHMISDHALKLLLHWLGFWSIYIQTSTVFGSYEWSYGPLFKTSLHRKLNWLACEPLWEFLPHELCSHGICHGRVSVCVCLTVCVCLWVCLSVCVCLSQVRVLLKWLNIVTH